MDSIEYYNKYAAKLYEDTVDADMSEIMGGFLELLEEIQVNGAYSRGTLVHVTEGPAGEQAEKEDQPEEGMPVHRLLNARYNEERCEIPRITEDGRYKGSVSWP